MEPFPSLEQFPVRQSLAPQPVPPAAPPLPPSPQPAETSIFKNDTVMMLWPILSTASMAASAYHGYKRNDSVGWAIWWAVMGAIFPVITPTIAIAQGFGKPAKKS